MLPAIALGTIPLAIITRITRAAVLEVADEDYVRTAEAKGMTAEVVNTRHILRNAMLPIVTIVGLQTGLLLAGAVLTELVFAWGGIGSFLYQGDRRSGLPGHRGRGAVRGGGDRPGQPGGGRHLRLARSQDPGVVNGEVGP